MNAKPEQRTIGEVVKDAFLFLVAPFITLAYLALFPFIGLKMLVSKVSADRRKRA